ncbi:hypothetical protein DRE_07465 [Drechslerella stenobrocha 248]|uniref:Uncharacterized protein n=1 Tax=Drechslerella stenobrocha 248 TaxID=1043628 RepID=W7HV29_9PEZI|nr:hypothetical protein DRE_07465 [Drechslerella stenobrocha 248]
MSQYQHTNPTHGTKNTTDPAAQKDPKKEYSGTVLSDSLAAESLRGGGGFSKGNPTGISDVTAASATTSRGDDTEGFRQVHGPVPFGRESDGEDGGESKKEQKNTKKKLQGGENVSRKVDAGHKAEARKEARKDKEGDDGFGGVNTVNTQPEIGSEEDPGRYAEQKFADRNVRRDHTKAGPTEAVASGRNENMFAPLEGA